MDGWVLSVGTASAEEYTMKATGMLVSQAIVASL